jgi:hypothetical protein
MPRPPTLCEAVRSRLRTLGQQAGPPDGVSFDAWRKALAKLCSDGVIRRFSWEIEGERFEAFMLTTWWPAGWKPLPLYVAGPRW